MASSMLQRTTSASIMLSLKVRLPGYSAPLTLQSDRNATAAQVLDTIGKKYKVPLDGRSLVIAPTSTTAGDIVPPEQLAANLDGMGVLEIWSEPYTINVAVSNGTSLIESRELAVDISMQLTSLVPLFQRIFASVSKELFVFRYLEANADETTINEDRWLSATRSLGDQYFKSEGWLILYPVATLAYRPAELGPPLKEGYMNKQAMKKGKYSNKKKKWCVCKDFFLYYYKNKEESQITRVLPLEYFFCRMVTTRDTVAKKNRVSIFLKRSLIARTMKVGEEYMLTSIDPDNAKELREWYDVLSSVCTSGDVRVFGVDLKEIMRREESAIPSIVLKCVHYLETNALDVEGLFRISASVSNVEYWKDKFNQEPDVDLSQCTDVHTVAGLLKLFLRELPDPVLTYEYYDAWIASHSKDITAEERVARVLELVEALPEQTRPYCIIYVHFCTKFPSTLKTTK